MFETETLIQNIKDLCRDSKQSVSSAIQAAGLNRSAVTDWSNGKGKPSLVSICKLSDYFHVTLDRLVYGETVSDISDFLKSLTPSEINHLEKYRQLNEIGQATVDGYIEGLKSAYPRESTVFPKDLAEKLSS